MTNRDNFAPEAFAMSDRWICESEIERELCYPKSTKVAVRWYEYLIGAVVGFGVVGGVIAMSLLFPPFLILLVLLFYRGRMTRYFFRVSTGR